MVVRISLIGIRTMLGILSILRAGVGDGMVRIGIRSIHGAMGLHGH